MIGAVGPPTTAWDRYREVWRRHKGLMTLVWIGVAVALPAGWLVPMGFAAQPHNRSILLAGWLSGSIGLLVAVASNLFLQRARRREGGGGPSVD